MSDDIDRYLRIMDSAGVDVACVNHIFFGDAARGNDLVARAVAEHPDRFIGVAFVTPHYPEEAVRELERAFDKLGMAYLKLYPNYVERPIDDPAYGPILEWCEERRVLVMCHTYYESEYDNTLTAPRRFIGLSERYPNIRWQLAHAGNGPPGQAQAVEAARASPNIYLETCTSLADDGSIEFLVEGAGADRVLFGSDHSLMDPRHHVGRIVTADIPEDAKRKVLGLNAIKLLGLER